MNTHHKYSNCPVVREGHVRFVRKIEVTGLGLEHRLIDFGRAIRWVRESTAVAVVRKKDGAVLKRFREYGDYYGFLTCVEDAVDEARQASEDYGPLVVEVVVTVEDLPLVPDGDPQYGRAGYLVVPSDWCVDTERARAYLVGGERPESPVSLQPVRRTHVAWSSRDDVDHGLREGRWNDFLADACSGMTDELRAKFATRVFHANAET